MSIRVPEVHDHLGNHPAVGGDTPRYYLDPAADYASDHE